MIELSKEQVIAMYMKMMRETGGNFGIRSSILLDSSLNNAFSTFGGNDLYPELEDKIANICFCIVSNHPFVDGNKRMGIYIMLVLLKLNNIKVAYEQYELVNLGLGLAEGKLTQSDIVRWIKEHSDN